MTAPMIEVKGFKKTFRTGFFRKKSVGARDVTFEVAPKEIFGFLGPNGAGKTTTIKALLGLIRPDGGTLTVCGYPPESQGWRSKLGYLPEHPNFYDYLTGLELVIWFGRLAGMARAEAEVQARKQLSRVGLAHAMTRRLRGYSKGMLQRAGLAQALMGSPQLLVLDEPMTGLDPIGRRDIRDLLLELRDEGRTIFYSTHILPDVEMTCDRVAILSKGAVRRTGKLEDILRDTTRGVSLALSSVSSELSAALLQAHKGEAGAMGNLQLELPDVDVARAVLAEATSKGAKLEKLEPHRDDLEAIFLKSLGDDRAELSQANL
jgi:ABC-2 type transport system ATP-binding protein